MSNGKRRRGVTAYTTRSMKVELLDRLRVVAALNKTTIEETLNRVVERGLEEVEREMGDD